MEIKDNNDRLNNIMKETDDIKLIIETHQNITEDNLRTQKTQLIKSKKHLREKLRN